jgi:hypothetical protein
VIDIASFRPRPKVRVMSVIARQKPPYWLGWPGTSYDVEGERARYTRAIADAAGHVGVEIAQEVQPLEDNAAVEAFCQMYGINVVHSPRTHEEAIQPPARG